MPNTLRNNVVIVTALIAIMLIVKLIDIALAPEHVYPGRVAAFPWVELAITAGAGLIGAVLAARSPILRLWPAQDTGKTLLLTFAIGAGLGAVLAAIDAWLRIGDMSVGLPLAPLFYLWGAVSQETITHFAPVALVAGLLTFVSDSRRAQSLAFWITATIMSALAALSMVAVFQNPDVPLHPAVAAAPMVIGAAVFLIEIALFAVFRAQGFIAALAMRLGFYAVWHIAWPLLAY